MKRLTAIAVNALKPGPVRREVPDGKGLYIIVQPSGRRSYAVRYRIGGKPRKLTLPRGISLAEARAAAAKALVEVEKGNDPAAAKLEQTRAQREAAQNTFQAVAELFLQLEGKKLRSADFQRKQLTRLVYPVIGSAPIATIKRKAIIDMLDGIEVTNGPVMAHSILSFVRRIMRWHAVRDEDYTLPIVPGMGRINADERRRSRTLSDDELRAVWRTAEQRADPYARMIQFLLLTAARHGEAGGMAWSEIVGDDWLLPAARNKVKVELLRPLSKAAQKLLAAQPKVGPLVFTYSAKALIGHSARKRQFDEACCVKGWVVHDLRRTSRTLLSRAGVHSDIAEQCLGHVLSGVRKTYNRDDFKPQKQHAFDALAAQIALIVNPPKDNIRTLRR
jgi:integrase